MEMRRNNGFYPSFFTDRTMMPRPSPTDWLRGNEDGSVTVGDVGDFPIIPEGQVEQHAIGDVVPFDHYEATDIDVMQFNDDGTWKLDGKLVAPTGFDSCWNPLDPTCTGYDTLDDFAVFWFAEMGGRPVAVEYITWTNNINYTLEEGPVAV